MASKAAGNQVEFLSPINTFTHAAPFAWNYQIRATFSSRASLSNSD